MAVNVIYGNALTAIPYNGSGLVNVAIKYQDGTTYNTAGFASSTSPTGATIRLYNPDNYNLTDASTLSVFYNPFINAYQAQIHPPVADRIKDVLRMRIGPRIYTHAKPLGFTKDLREIRARETLHRVLGTDKYKSFLRKGFISVKAKSGLVYQIFPSHDFTKVYNCGVMINRYCVVLKGDFPPTDSLIMRYLLILNNEKMFEDLAVKHGVSHPHAIEMPQDNRSLLEIFKDFKRAA